MIGRILASPGFWAICQIITMVIMAYVCIDLWLFNRRNRK